MSEPATPSRPQGRGRPSPRGRGRPSLSHPSHVDRAPLTPQPWENLPALTPFRITPSLPPNTQPLNYDPVHTISVTPENTINPPHMGDLSNPIPDLISDFNRRKTTPQPSIGDSQPKGKYKMLNKRNLKTLNRQNNVSPMVKHVSRTRGLKLELSDEKWVKLCLS